MPSDFKLTMKLLRYNKYMNILFALIGSFMALALTLVGCCITLMVAASGIIGGIVCHYVRRWRAQENVVNIHPVTTDFRPSEKDENRPHITVGSDGIAVAHHRDEAKLLYRGSKLGLCQNPYGRTPEKSRRKG